MSAPPRRPLPLALLDLAAGLVVEAGERCVPRALVDALVHCVLTQVEPPIVDPERHLERLAQAVGKCRLVLLSGRRFVVGKASHEQRDDVVGASQLGEPPHFFIDVLACPRVRRAQHQELARRVQMPGDRRVIVRAGEIFFVAEDVEILVSHVECARRLVGFQTFLELPGEVLVLARVADERVVDGTDLMRSIDGTADGSVPIAVAPSSRATAMSAMIDESTVGEVHGQRKSSAARWESETRALRCLRATTVAC